MSAIRIAMWSGPRNISTAMMRAFENRPDTAVIDEPFYAAYLAATGIDHPLRAEVLQSQPNDWRAVERQLLGLVPQQKPIFYQKHMTHHMLPGIGRAWTASCRNAFLIRNPCAVLQSYRARRDGVTLADIGIVQQSEIFDEISQRVGAPPPVIDSADILANPQAALSALCDALQIPFTDAMLRWPPGRRDTDGVWAPAWYESVERSTGFAQTKAAIAPGNLSPELAEIAYAAQPYFAAMARHTITPHV
jgi:hypothetical protein